MVGFCKVIQSISYELINIKHENKLSLLIEEFDSRKSAKVCYLCHKKFPYSRDINLRSLSFIGKLKGVACSVSNLRYSVLKGIPLIMRSGSNYDFYGMIKHLATEFEECNLFS